MVDISGGENISTVEVEPALISQPDVMDEAVAGAPGRMRKFVRREAARDGRADRIQG